MRSVHRSGTALVIVALFGVALSAQKPTASATPADPTKLEVPLPASAGWKASLVIDNEKTGIWTVDAFNVFPQFGTPEIVGLDDKGRCLVLAGYSGKWTPSEVLHEGKWLGGLAHGDVDPRIPGAELYVGGQKGNVYQVVAYPHGALDARLIAHLPGLEIHTLLAGDLDASAVGSELLVFTRPGNLYRLRPTGDHGTFRLKKLQTLSGRVRDAKVLSADGETPELMTVSRNGRIESLRLTPEGPKWRLVYKATMGLGRIDVRRGAKGRPAVFYATHDDGRVLRFERRSDEWTHETIYLGPQGPRGVAAGRFDADPNVETVAVFGYSKRVQLLTRAEKGWTVETLFVDRDKGHWLATAELDGRNATDEIIGSGYGSRIFLLSRPPGYGRRGAVDPDSGQRRPELTKGGR